MEVINLSEKPNVTVIYQDAKPDAKPGFLDWFVAIVGIAIMAVIIIGGRHW
jgi:hypothetical protein